MLWEPRARAPHQLGGTSVQGALEELVILKLTLEEVRGVNSGQWKAPIRMKRMNKQGLRVPEMVEADEAGEAGDQGVRGFVCHVKDLSLENGSHLQSFQQRSCVIRCVIWRSQSGAGWVESELG